MAIPLVADYRAVLLLGGSAGRRLGGVSPTVITGIGDRDGDAEAAAGRGLGVSAVE